MRTLAVAVAGFAFQIAGLVIFLEVAASSGSASAKLLVIGATGVVMALLLWLANTPFRLSRAVIQSALLAFGFLVAQHALAVFFPGLMKDVEFLSIEHVRNVVLMFVSLFALYLAGSVVFGMLGKFMLSSGRRTSTP